MMRWNNTKTYTEEDILRMQQEAVSRVHDFQARAQNFYDVPASDITEIHEDSSQGYLKTGEGQVIEAQSREIAPAEQYQGQYNQPPAQYYESQEYDQPRGQSRQDPPAAYEQPREPAAYRQPPASQETPWLQTPRQKSGDPIKGLLENFHLDSETLLILGLMFLLYNEKADNVLLLALGYLLL